MTLRSPSLTEGKSKDRAERGRRRTPLDRVEFLGARQ